MMKTFKHFRVDKFFAVLLVLLVLVSAARSDMYIFSKEDLANSKSCIDRLDFDVFFKNNDRDQFCAKHCDGREHEAPFRSNAAPYRVDFDTKYDHLSASGLLHYYRSFVYSFLEKVQNETNEENPQFKVNIELSRLQMAKLQRFSESINYKDASDIIQETTHILKNMLQGVERVQPVQPVEIDNSSSSFSLGQYAFFILAAMTKLIVMISHHNGYEREPWLDITIILFFVAFALIVFTYLFIGLVKLTLIGLFFFPYERLQCFEKLRYYKRHFFKRS